MIQVMLVDDHRLVRSGLKKLVDDAGDMKVVAEADTGEQALEAVRKQAPDVILMDINMPGIGGLEATRRMLQSKPGLKVIGLSMHAEDPFPSRLLAVGAAGYLTKDCAAEEILTAIRKVHSGGHYITPTVAGNLAVSLATGKNQNSPFAALSQREMQVMLMVTNGSSIQEISDSLCLSPKTVSTYRYRLFEKLGVDNDVELTRMAMRHGILESDDVAAHP